MCGIFFTIKNLNDHDKANFLECLDLIKRRGPDSDGYKQLIVDKFILEFGFRRLAIQDLSDNGNQPFVSDRGNILLFNGEIYNHKTLRKLINQKKYINWRSSSDTETIINYIDNFGLDSFLENVNGMFAIVIYNIREKKLIFCRDHAGEKPLYFSLTNNFLSLSSDLSPIINSNNFIKEVNSIALNQYLNYNYIPNPETIYKNIFKIPPGSKLEIDLNKFDLFNLDSFNKLEDKENIYFSKWWDYPRFKINKNDSSKINHLEDLLVNSVKKQLISDAPLGAFLSGGIDSSLIVAIASKFISDLQTFTIGFDFDKYDESKYAKKISNYFGTKHETLICSKDDVINNIEYLQEAYTEPFADSSQLPTLLVSKIAKSKVKVALSGDGGDELFGGYNRYSFSNKYWKIINFLPISIRSNLLRIFNTLPSSVIDVILKFILSKDTTRNNSNSKNIINKLIKIQSDFDFYNSFITEYSEASVINDDYLLNHNFKDTFQNFEFNNITEKMMACDFVTYMTDDILCKVDRASMFNSLEVRAPYLDRDLVNFVINLPFDKKIKNNKTKIIQREILESYIPMEFFDRPKMGFSIPLSDWLKTDLKEFMNDALSHNTLNKHNFFNIDKVKLIKDNHEKNIENNASKLWALIQFNLWYENNF